MGRPGDLDPATAEGVLAGGGAMGALIRAHDWSATPVGPVSSWPQSLRTTLSIVLESGFPMYVAWGPEFTQFYNDSYRPILGSTKHPAVGRSTTETFREIWHIIGPMFRGVLEGRSTTVVDFLLPLDRHGFVEECYFVFSYSPIREESGRVGGVLVTVTETTGRVLGERRLQTSQALAERTRHARTIAQAGEVSAAVLAENPADLPFALIYRLDSGGPVVAGAAGVDPSRCEPGQWPIDQVARARQAIVVDPLPTGIGPWTDDDPDRPRRAVVLPVLQPGGEEAVGVLVAGTSPRLMLDDGYRGFLSLLSSQVGSAIASAGALEEAKARAEALAALDREKTAFFSNVSHEFRTPLTLILGPVEAALASPGAALVADDLEAVYRNALRLLKLVNALLDFSRIEGGRMVASYAPVDLGSLTADLASSFRSAVERAGLELRVDCPRHTEAAYVDPEMWEKIVLNLLSNALKYTLEGAIEVSVAPRGAWIELRVADTGVGIAESELPRIFDRFHRVEGPRARTQEGSGIGLALVKELVALHQGAIEVESAPGRGTTFTVRLPAGSAHVPPTQARAAPPPPSPTRARPFVEEALRWLPSGRHAPDAAARAAPARGPSIRIVVADDNADMRDYLARLLGERWAVELVSDGLQALEAVHRQRPDLVLVDVMMPGLDGFGVIRRLRADPRTRSIPVIVLSARAGEEARVDGLSQGADDYLVKPFSARELVARVQSQLVRSKSRTLEEAQAIRLASVFEHAPVGVAILSGPELVFEFANRVYAALVGDRPVVGQPLRTALPEFAGQGIFELLERVYTTGEPYVGRSLRLMVFRAGALEECFFDFVYQPLLDDQGEVSGISAIVFEVTELARARRAAEAANRAKDEFLAMLGHELRNPLAPILTALRLMRLHGVEEAQRERGVIERQLRHVVSLVDDLLDVSRIAKGKVELRRERVDLADVVAEAVEMTGPALEQRKHELLVDVPRGLVVRGDAARLAQVVSNLLGNAAKYCDPRGHVRVRAKADQGFAVLEVEDDGVGIAPEMLPRVFDLFSQEGQDIDRSQGGLGLGLAIVRSLVTAHGGAVSAHSEGKGLGALFRIRLPLTRRDALLTPLPAPSRPAQVAGRRVLVVDDNVDAADLVADVLRSVGHTVQVAYDGPTALEGAAAFGPDVVLLDLGLPVMDGYEVARRLRADRPRVEIVALSGYGQTSDRQRTTAAGFDAHLVKPVDLDQLEAVLSVPGRR